MVRLRRQLNPSRKNTRSGKGKGKGPPPSPGPERCSPYAVTRRNSKSCVPQSIMKRVVSRNTRRGGGKECSKNNTRCIVETSDLNQNEKKEILNTYFRPAMPQGWKRDPDMWLNSDDIQVVMKQYEKACPEFRFLGVVPIDFSAPDPYTQSSGPKCMNDQFCHVDVAAERAAGKKILGAIFNLDPHYKGGSHWVGLAIDLQRNKVYYFDSYGMPPPSQVARFMRYLTLQDKRFVLESNGRRFQYSDTECGMYSMYFIIRMIQGANFKNFVRNPISDKWMLKFRKVLFDPDA
jgi:hypothetical protein